MIPKKRRERMKRLALKEESDMCRRYKYECKELGTHIETNKEKVKRLKDKAKSKNKCWKLSL